MKELIEFIKSLDCGYPNINIICESMFAHRYTQTFSILKTYLDKIDFGSTEFFHLEIYL